MKIIYITPYLSTGGMPEYLRKKVELMSEDNTVWVIEKNFEPAYRTIRDKIENIIGDRLIKLNNNQEKLLTLITDIQPDIIHFEEMSDYYFTQEVLEKIYTKDRTYKIFETLHDSSIESYEKRFIPDKMLLVSHWQMKNFLDLNIPIEIIEHEIEAGTRDRSILTKLNLDLDKKHVLQVGIFSKRKNQAEVFELARIMPDVMFHFIGNQSTNYKSYWEPLLNNKPDNCIIWGERNDTHLFYSCMDCVIFPSIGTYGDRETNPLVIKEAIAWDIPLFLRNVSVYMDMYNESKNLMFMSDNLEINKELLNKFLDKNQNDNMELNKDFFKQKLFNISFNEEDNKISFNYLKDELINTKICIRDLDTEVSIYTFNASFQNNSTAWCIPIPKPFYDFMNNPYFGGFLYDFYIDDVRVYVASTRLKNPITRKTKFRLNIFDPIFINYEQFFTEKIYQNFFSQIDTFDNVIDIGSNIGLFTELMLKYDAKNIISVEINDEAIETFNRLHNEDDRVKLVKTAISDKAGEIEIFIDPKNSLIGSIHPGNVVNPISYKLDAISMDDLLKQESLSKIDLIKIDIEGAEYSLFEGFSIENLKNVKFILMEFHNNYNSILSNILIKLTEAGFIYEIYQDDCVNYASEYEERGAIFAKNVKI